MIVSKTLKSRFDIVWARYRDHLDGVLIKTRRISQLIVKKYIRLFWHECALTLKSIPSNSITDQYYI